MWDNTRRIRSTNLANHRTVFTSYWRSTGESKCRQRVNWRSYYGGRFSPCREDLRGCERLLWRQRGKHAAKFRWGHGHRSYDLCWYRERLSWNGWYKRRRRSPRCDWNFNRGQRKASLRCFQSHEDARHDSSWHSVPLLDNSRVSNIEERLDRDSISYHPRSRYRGREVSYANKGQDN